MERLTNWIYLFIRQIMNKIIRSLFFLFFFSFFYFCFIFFSLGDACERSAKAANFRPNSCPNPENPVSIL